MTTLCMRPSGFWLLACSFSFFLHSHKLILLLLCILPTIAYNIKKYLWVPISKAFPHRSLQIIVPLSFGQWHLELWRKVWSQSEISHDMLTLSCPDDAYGTRTGPDGFTLIGLVIVRESFQCTNHSHPSLLSIKLVLLHLLCSLQENPLCATLLLSDSISIM